MLCFKAKPPTVLIDHAALTLVFAIQKITGVKL